MFYFIFFPCDPVIFVQKQKIKITFGLKIFCQASLLCKSTVSFSLSQCFKTSTVHRVIKVTFYAVLLSMGWTISGQKSPAPLQTSQRGSSFQGFDLLVCCACQHCSVDGIYFETLSKDHIQFFRVLALKPKALNLRKDTVTHADKNQSFLKSLQRSSNFPELSAWIRQNEGDILNVICAHVKRNI